MESIEQTFNGSADFGRKVTCPISRNGDLIHRVYAQITLPAVPVTAGANPGDNEFRWVDNVGHALIRSVEIEIGGKHHKHYGEWLEIWNDLTQTPGHAAGYNQMIGMVPELTTVQDGTAGKMGTPERTLYVPLQFWFCRNPGLALPLIALQYHEVKINLEFAEKSAVAYIKGSVTVPSIKSASLYVDFVFLDTDERRRFAQVSHEQLIEQLQFTGSETVTSTNNKVKLSFNHPCKSLIWTVLPNKNVDPTNSDVAAAKRGIQWANFTDAPIDATGKAGGNPVVSAKLQLNGHDRFSEREGRYFNLVQPFQHFTNVPAEGINLYSFGLKPEEHQPSGTCNMSRIDTATLQLTLTPKALTGGSASVSVYAINYNVLRVLSGMGGLAYSN